MDTQEIWRAHSEEVYFFILKRVKDTEAASDILQNTFYNTHKNLNQIEDLIKIRSWVFQIARNEIADYFKREAKYSVRLKGEEDKGAEKYQDICCFNRFIEELPEHYKSVIKLVYIDGKTQIEAAQVLKISLANVKARIRRAKSLLKQRFNECCKYEINKNGQLTGEPDCAECFD
ncbi:MULTISPECIES: sigma-70 family RNA polymerase sigma factor [Salegentibacter]|uniref:RNA polymerase, sigma subunit, SigZ n=2 Tax=Salegentibacter TaxID=143222 RepID=A0A1T5AVW3_9FLAO|nr:MULTISPECIES: sigma-70 family RNA polymerase sigma factor [Salegentibacter]PRX44411.1 RNA polymerase sigma (SigZ) subunit [Salegentibacter salegens]SHM61468.1 RNA polymerase, sigma subunit, SigZ [Salegentibacter salegens]SKB39105.1 RNA polymerase, sigma subunit, SigZ [Salegentibacter holothuriorum]